MQSLIEQPPGNAGYETVGVLGIERDAASIGVSHVLPISWLVHRRKLSVVTTIAVGRPVVHPAGLRVIGASKYDFITTRNVEGELVVVRERPNGRIIRAYAL